ncbi:MAG TPA: ATPase domain-containing protein [Actinoplanes sp.]|nr:ATPase domain-containing protein [Actinoplanes sp.]
MTKRVSTGLADLDQILGGGLKPGSVVVVAGPPGTGKTILAQQICFANGTTERRAVYYTTLSEPHSKLVEHLTPFSFFDPTALGTKVEVLHLGDLLEKAATAGLDPLVNEVIRKAMDDQPSIVVIDSVKMLRDYASDKELRAALYRLTSRVAHSETVLLLLGEYTAQEMSDGPEFALADGILQLAYESREPVDRRWIRVVKLRGGTHLEGKHTFHLGLDGFTAFPRIEAMTPAAMPTFTGRLQSGIPGLRELSGGGIPRGDSVLILGQPGVGKTICALRFVAEGLTDGERCLYITFQDTADQLIGMARGFGWDLESARAEKLLTISHVPMDSLDLDVLAAVIREELADGQVSRVVIDSLAEMVFAARESERFPAYMRRLIGLIRAAGASLLVTSETTTLGPAKESLSGIVFLFHDVIQLRYIERNSKVDRALNIVKMRNSDHETGVHLCTITNEGLQVGEPLEGVTGILGWTTLTEALHAEPLPTSAGTTTALNR